MIENIGNLLLAIGVNASPRWIKWYTFICIVFALFGVLFPSTCAIKHHGSKNAPTRLFTEPEWTRRRTKNSECRLGGGGRYALNSTWSPDLGPPFGVWSCVKCKCTPVAKKRRIVARVICKNIKNECPLVRCKDAILPAGACCKLCPVTNEDFREDDLIQKHDPYSEDLAAKDFAVLLNGRTSIQPLMTRNLATGRIFLRRSTLHFSFVLSAGTATPTNIQFTDEHDTILEELEAQPTPYEVNNGRICGTWTRVPKQYKSILLKEKMWVTLQSDIDEDAISGRISRYKGVETEVFSALMSPDPKSQEPLLGGGTAIISVSAPSDSLHISLVFNGVFPTMGAKGAPIEVELTPSRALEAVKETVHLQKVYSDLNKAEIMTTLGNTSLRLLTRGKVSLKISSPDAPHLAIEGLIIARATCNVYSSLLASKPSAPNARYGAGWALLSVSNDGDFKYKIQVDDLPSPVKRVSFHHQSKKKMKQVEDITSFYENGWAIGTFTKPTYRDLDMLLRGRFVAMVTLDNGQALEGSFQTISATEALRTPVPTLLKNSASWVVATAWVAVDSACVMHYDIYIGGEDPGGNRDPTWSLQLREEDTTWDPRLDLKNSTLEERATGREMAAHTTTLTKVSLTRLSKDISYLDLTVLTDLSKDGGVVLSGKVEETVVPASCTLEEQTSYTEQSKPADATCRGPICILQDEEEARKTASTKCIDHEKKVYEDGTTWPSPLNNCQRCMCTLGLIHCQDEPCPVPSCIDPVTLPGQCCPSCPVVSGSLSERVCEMDKEFHSIGSFWHPFLAPKGFDPCVTCYCNVTSTMEPRIDCQWAKCPRLPCLEMDAEVVEGSCCRRCPPTTSPSPLAPIIKELIRDDAEDRKERKTRILNDGGCLERLKYVRKDGETWLPQRAPKGKKKCVFCTCHEGQIDCYTNRCPKKHCGGRGGKSCLLRDDFNTRRRKSKKKNPKDPNRKARRKERKRRKKNRKNRKRKNLPFELPVP